MLLNDLECNNAELSILITGDEEIRELNKSYRANDSATDVLSFPMGESGSFPAVAELLGDVVISLNCVERQAVENEVSVKEEILRLLTHGILHLVGYDHEFVSEQESKKMFETEDALYDKFVPCIMQNITQNKD